MPSEPLPPASPGLREQFAGALRDGDVGRVRALLEGHAEVRALVNAPLGAFGGRPIHMAAKNLAMLDALLAHGADINLKSDWWAGGFGIFESSMTSAEASALVARGAVIDVFGAANLGMLDRVRELVEAEPSLVHARGGDGKTPLHWAHTVEIARYLLDRGAEIDARDVDHESTPAQYLVREAPGVARFLIDRGAWLDIFIAVGLRDPALVERCLREDPEALDHRTWQGKYTTVHKGRPSAREEIGDHRGDVYRWVFGHNVSALDAAADLGYGEIVELLLRHATPAQRLLAACGAADAGAARAILSSHPDLVSRMTPDQMRLIVDKAHANDTAAVSLMVDLGFDPHARGVEDWEAFRWAAFHGNAALVKQLLPHDPPLNVPDPTYGGTPLGQCLYGARHSWHCRRGDYPATVKLLLEAGERARRDYLPTGREEIDRLLRGFLEG